jgi:hypothetical protein
MPTEEPTASGSISSISSQPVDKYGATNKAAVENAQRIAAAVAPGKSVFFKQYAGGTRYSPTYTEMEDARVEVENKAEERKFKRDLENSTKINEAQEKIRQAAIDKKVQTAKDSPIWSTLTKPQQDRVVFNIQTGEKAPEFTQQDLEITGKPEFKNGSIFATNRAGIEMNVEEDWRKNNQAATAWLDMQKTGEKNLDKAREEAAKFEISASRLQQQYLKAKMIHEGAAAKRESEEWDKQNRILRQTNQRAAMEILKKIDKDWSAERIRLDAETQGLSGDLTLEERVTGKQPDGSDSKFYKPIKDKYGNPYKSLQDYEDAWKTAQIPGGIDSNRYRYFSITGKDPLGEIPGSLDFGPGWNAKNKKEQEGKGKPANTLPAPPVISRTTPSAPVVSTPGKRTGSLLDTEADRQSLLNEWIGSQ